MTASAGVVPDGPRRPEAGAEPGLWVLVAALVAGVVGYGGFGYYGRPMVVLLLVAVLVSVLPVVRGWSSLAPEVAWSAGALGGLGTWALLRGLGSPDPLSGVPALGLCVALAVVVVLVHLTPPGGRDALVRTLVVVGALAALSGWVGVVWRVWPLVLADQGLWRASGSIGYPNALAGLLVPLALVSLARASAPGRSARLRAVEAALACLLVLGVLAAMSRIGLALAVGGVLALLVVRGPRRLLLAAWPPLAGGVVAMAGVLPSVQEGAAGDPLVAVAGLVAGLAVAVGGAWATPPVPGEAARSAAAASRSTSAVAPGSTAAPTPAPAAGRGPRRRLVLAVGGGLAVLGAGLAAAPGALAAGLSSALGARATLASSWRVEQHVAAWRELAAHPWLGTGPGGADLQWTTPDGRTLLARYVHDEYVQVVVELGAVGGVLLAGVLATVAVVLARGRPVRPSDVARPGETDGAPELSGGPSGEPSGARDGAAAAWAGAVVAVTAFAVHSGFDFLWHVPVLPLVVTVLLAAASRPPRSPDRSRDSAASEAAAPPATSRDAGQPGTGDAIPTSVPTRSRT